MESSSAVHAVAGSASALVFGADKVITDFDWDAKRVSWVELKVCLGKLMVKRTGFEDLMVLAGCSGILPCLPALEGEEKGVARIQAA